MFTPLILDYIETPGRQRHADIVIDKLTKRDEDIRFLLELLDEMRTLVNGEDRQKIIRLIRHPLFDRHFRKLLFSNSSKKQLLACVYYAKSGYMSKKMIHRLIDLSASEDIKLAYASAKVLQNSPHGFIRLQTLRGFFIREDATSLMVGELLHFFHHNVNEMYETSDYSLKSLLLQKSIAKERKQIIIDYIAHHNLYEYSHFLHSYLKKLLYRPENRPLIQSLITALGTLRVDEADTLIRSYASLPDAELRMCCVEALNDIGGEENLNFISNMLFDIEFDVRKRIIRTLVQNPDKGHELLEKFMLTYLRFLARVWGNELPPNDVVFFIHKLRSITSGIRIMSANSVRRKTPVL